MRSMWLALSFILLLLSGCGTTTETVIKPEVIKVPVPVVTDTIRVTRVDTVVVEAVKVVKGDTVVDIRYYPKEQKVWYKVKPDTVTLIHMDTTTTTVIRNIETPFMSKVGIFFSGFIILGSIAAAGFWLIKNKFIKLPF
jgi:hypothetical protein